MKTKLVSWRDVAKPHKDIMEGRFDLSLFAVNIYRVCKGGAPPDYQDPHRFFSKTYMTKALKSLVSSVMRRLDGELDAEPITDLMTSFGGGKSHVLLCLYHLASNGKKAADWQGVDELLKESKLKTVPKAAVAVLSGEDFDPAQGEKGDGAEPTRNTLWGELAWQLGGRDGYSLVKKNDEFRSAPTANTIERILKLNDSNLILVDEALRFVTRSRAIPVHETSLGAQTLEFFRALTEAVSSTPKAALVATLQASTVEMARDDEPDYMRLVEIFKRLGKPVRLAEGEEIYDIVKRRLFDESGGSREAKQVANAYFDFYQDHRDSFPQNVTTPSYLAKLERAYPFHPELLDLLNERWSAIPHFQRTRGILRMLATMIAELYKNDTSPLIHASAAPLGARDFRTEVLQQLHAEGQFDAVVESDISGTGARAQRIDQSGNLTYQREHIAESVATSIFLYSFGGSAGTPSASVASVSLATLRPGLEPAFIPDAIQALRKPITGLFYLQPDGESYRFTVNPNLNMILAEREIAADKGEVEKLLLESIKDQVGTSKFNVVPFPAEPRDVSDHPQLTLVIMRPEDTLGKNTKASTEEKILSIVKGGTTYRTYRNCLVFAVPEEGHRMMEAARTSVALEDIDRLYNRTNRLSDLQESQLHGMTNDAQKALVNSIWRAYRYAISPGPEDKLEQCDMGVRIEKAGKKITDSIWETLVLQERLAPRIGPSRLLSKDLALWPEDRKAISTKELRDAFLTFTHLPMIPSVDSLKETMIQGVAEGQFGIAYGSLEKNEFHSVRIGSTIERDAIEFTNDVYLLRPNYALELLGTVGPEPHPPEPGGQEPTKGRGLPPPPPGLETYASVVVSADLDWKKWAEFHDAVIQPLINSGAKLNVRVEVKGTSEEGISPNTVDLAVKESLVQYGITANIEAKKKTSENPQTNLGVKSSE